MGLFGKAEEGEGNLGWYIKFKKDLDKKIKSRSKQKTKTKQRNTKENKTKTIPPSPPPTITTTTTKEIYYVIRLQLLCLPVFLTFILKITEYNMGWIDGSAIIG